MGPHKSPAHNNSNDTDMHSSEYSRIKPQQQITGSPHVAQPHGIRPSVELYVNPHLRYDMRRTRCPAAYIRRTMVQQGKQKHTPLTSIPTAMYTVTLHPGLINKAYLLLLGCTAGIHTSTFACCNSWTEQDLLEIDGRHHTDPTNKACS